MQTQSRFGTKCWHNIPKLRYGYISEFFCISVIKFGRYLFLHQNIFKNTWNSMNTHRKIQKKALTKSWTMQQKQLCKFTIKTNYFGIIDSPPSHDRNERCQAKHSIWTIWNFWNVSVLEFYIFSSDLLNSFAIVLWYYIYSDKKFLFLTVIKNLT